MTTPDPAVSVSPVDTDGLREQIAARFAELDARDWGYDHGFVAYGADEESDAFVDAAAELFADREAQLLDQVARLQNRLSIMRGAHQQERDALSLMLRGMARRASWLRADCQDNHDTAETYRYERDTAREQRDQYRHNWDYARQVNEQAAETIAASEKEIARLRAELASRSTPPQDAGLPDTAERLAALARDFRDRAEKTITKALEGEQVADECDSPAECHASTEHFTWKLAALQVEKLVTALSSPATDPVPATPDGPHRVNFVVAEWDERIAFATCRDCLARISGDRPDVWEWKRLHEGAEDARCTKVNGDGARCIKGRALPHWCVFDETEPVAPQAPAEPPVGDALCGQVHDGLTCVHPRQAGQNGCWGHYGPEEDPQAHYRCDARWHIAGQNPCPRCEPIPGRPLPAVPAVPEDTATPDDEYSDDLAATFLRSSAGECREMVPDGPESYMSCGADTVPGTDRCDDHRADTTRPADSPSTSTPKEA